jgi:DNA polymerase-3 subunit epsilon
MEVREVTGLTDEMLKGQRFDEDMVRAVLGDGHLCIAHHAEFDRPKLERRFPEFAEAFWACSWKDVDWRKAGYSCGKLEHLLQDGCWEFYDAHSATEDAAVGLHILASIDMGGAPALQTLLSRARVPSYHVWALDAPFDVKDELKFAQPTRYEWNDGTDGRPKAWHVSVRGEAALVAQLTFLRDVYNPKRIGIKRVSAKDRYSIRETKARPGSVMLMDALVAASAAITPQEEPSGQ